MSCNNPTLSKMRFEVKDINIFSNPSVIFHLDSPKPGLTGTSILEISGWLLGQETPITQIRIGTSNSYRNFPLNEKRFDVVAEQKTRATLQDTHGIHGFKIFFDLEDVPSLMESPSLKLEIYSAHPSMIGHVWKKLADINVFLTGIRGRDTNPIFIMGSERSGTSVLRDALVNVLKIPGFGEGHLIPIFSEIHDLVRSYYQKYE